MLPKNTQRDRHLARLKIFEGPQHPYEQKWVWPGRRAWALSSFQLSDGDC